MIVYIVTLAEWDSRRDIWDYTLIKGFLTNDEARRLMVEEDKKVISRKHGPQDYHFVQEVEIVTELSKALTE